MGGLNSLNSRLEPVVLWAYRLNMELQLVYLGSMLTAVLIGPHRNPPFYPYPHLGSYTRALLVSQDRLHLFVTPLLWAFAKVSLPRLTIDCYIVCNTAN
jgi:hypothetical protein